MFHKKIVIKIAFIYVRNSKIKSIESINYMIKYMIIDTQFKF